MNIALITELLIPVVKKIVSKPKKGTKELAGLTVVAPMAYSVYEQYIACGFGCVDVTNLTALIGGVLLFAQRIYIKHKDDSKPDTLN